MNRLDDTSRCPQADQCAACGSTDDLAVDTLQTQVGVFCLTLCGDCSDNGRLPDIQGWPALYELVGAHCVHLGVDLDQMAALISAEKEGQR